ncbi:hypothetical protein V8G54_004773 [Vigna mungo]|uniref:Uncharacterized protein n=1 Tax=Vigna mungo TaxID=3915 RepID=A0AAQ3SBG2_VIGMU
MGGLTQETIHGGGRVCLSRDAGGGFPRPEEWRSSCSRWQWLSMGRRRDTLGHHSRRWSAAFKGGNPNPRTKREERRGLTSPPAIWEWRCYGSVVEWEASRVLFKRESFGLLSAECWNERQHGRPLFFLTWEESVWTRASPFPFLILLVPSVVPSNIDLKRSYGKSEGWLVDASLGILWLGLKMTVWGFCA